MICFDVFVNGKHLCRAGVGTSGVLTAIVDWVGGTPESPSTRARIVPGNLWLHVGGLYSANENTNIYPQWANEQLAPGDEIAVKIVEAERSDKPVEEKVDRRELIEREQRKYYSAMKKTFEPASPSKSGRSSSRSGRSAEKSRKRASASREATRLRKSSRKKKR